MQKAFRFPTLAQRSSSLFQLPIELIVIIFACLFNPDEPVKSVRECREDRKKGDSNVWQYAHSLCLSTQILRTCQRAFKIGHEALYDNKPLSIFVFEDHFGVFWHLQKVTLHELMHTHIQCWHEARKLRLEQKRHIRQYYPELALFKKVRVVLVQQSVLSSNFGVCLWLQRLLAGKDVPFEHGRYYDDSHLNYLQAFNMIRCNTINFSFEDDENYFAIDNKDLRGTIESNTLPPDMLHIMRKLLESDTARRDINALDVIFLHLYH